MRKFVVLSGAVAIVAASISLTAGASVARVRGHAAAPLCGTLYTPPCRPPSGTVVSITSCRNTGAVLHFPITARSNAGLKSVMVRGVVTKNYVFKGRPTSKTVSVTVNTRGFKPGLYSLTVKITDTKNKNAIRVAHFSICKPKPVFTG